MKKIINNDTFGIVDRLKSIDSSYFVVWNTLYFRYEVHSHANTLNTFCLAVPYLNLDSRTVDLVLKTRVENMDKLILEMDKHNSKGEKI